jgi:Tol biopolymer transport system component
MLIAGCEKEDINIPPIDDFPYDQLEGNIVFNRRNENFAIEGAKNTQDIFIMPANKSREPKNLGEGYVPTLSPDGSKIAFILLLEGTQRGIYTMDTQGNNKKLIHKTDRIGIYRPDWLPSWSPDSKKLAYMTGGYEINILDVESSQVEKTISMDVVVRNVKWSSDGTQLGYLGFTPSTSHSEDIFVIDIDDPSTPVNITKSLSIRSIYDWDWSSQDDNILAHFTINENHTPRYRLCVFKKGEEIFKEIIPSVSLNSRPKWSPTGEFILDSDFNPINNSKYIHISITDKDGLMLQRRFIEGFNADW